MGDGENRYDNELGNGGSFVIGLLAGTVLGAGLGLLFAPKSGSDLRNQISDQAGQLRTSAQDGYRRARETANDWAGKGRQIVDKARDTVEKARETVAARADEA